MRRLARRSHRRKASASQTSISAMTMTPRIGAPGLWVEFLAKQWKSKDTRELCCICPAGLRGIKAIEDVLRISEDIDEQEEVEMDRYLTLDGWMNYKEAAEEQLSKYKGGLRAIMENYGIKTEGEIFSGCICEMRNRISDRDQDDMSFYNTNEVIEKKVTNFFKEFRIEFFQVGSSLFLAY
ncbi:hypothetical protein OSTOST_03197 [Ostertagia ostertagi]